MKALQAESHEAAHPIVAGAPDARVSVRKAFGIDSDMEAPAYAAPDEHVPDFDPHYLFDRDTTLAILALSLIHI